MRLLYFTNIPAPYNVDFLNELGKYCSLDVLYERIANADRDESWKKYNFQTFNGIFLPKNIFSFIKYLDPSKYDAIILGNATTRIGILAVMYMKLMNIPYILQSEGGIPKNGVGFKENFKKWHLKGAKLYLSGMMGNGPIKEYFLTYGGTSKNILSYPFSSLFNKEVLQDAPSKATKAAQKHKLGINYEKIILSVGQFIPRKGYDILIKACKNLPSNVGVYLIGGVPPQKYIDLINELGIKNIHFVNFMPREEVNAYYQLSDFFVLPTREDTWGLVINEAMANGCPIITTDNCVAGSELIVNDENGYIVPVGNIEELNRRMIELLNDEAKCTFMANNNIKKIRYYTLENMAKVHYDILSKFLNIK